MKIEDRMDSTQLKDLGQFTSDELEQDLDGITAKPSVTLRDLYFRWERQNWQSGELDFTQDKSDWENLDDPTRNSLAWFFNMFYNGEEAVTEGLVPWVYAAPTVDMQHFLTTQLVDETRHTVFFDRFYREVLGVKGDLAAVLEQFRGNLNDGYQHLFYELLPSVGKELVASPGDPVVFARAICMYHMIIEGMLAVPGQKYLLSFCRQRNVLPAFRAGFTAVARDESRHVGGGVRILQQLIAMDPDSVDAVQSLLVEAFPSIMKFAQPPAGDFTRWSAIGYDVGELIMYATQHLEKRLRAAGIELPAFPSTRNPRVENPVFTEMEPSMTQQFIREAGDSVTIESIFMAMPAGFNAELARGVNTTIQFEISDEGVWRVQIADGECRTEAGPGEHSLRLATDRDTWLGVSAGRFSGSEAILAGLIEMEGHIGQGIRFDSYFSGV